tara:strand:+ start:3255 stop:3590 length:336 start_codon:yes stop_codon:yes gene_type:complete
MSKIKILISITFFSFLLIGTSILKNKTRQIEKNIYNLSKVIYQKEKDYNESQLDFEYLSSPIIIEQRINHLDRNEYFPMEYSKIFLSMANFIDLSDKIATQKNNEKKIKKK